MKKNIKLLLLLIIFFSCAKNIKSYRLTNVKIPENINITEKEIKSILNFNDDKNNNYYTLAITIFSYSSGVETIGYSEDEKLTHKSQDGKIKILLKIKKKNKLKKVIFVSAKGKDKDEILNNLLKKIKKIL